MFRFKLLKLHYIYVLIYSFYFMISVDTLNAQKNVDTSVTLIKSLKETHPDSALKILRFKLDLLKDNPKLYHYNLLLMANQLASISKNDTAIKLYLQCDAYYTKNIDSFSLYSINAGLGKVYDNINDYQTEKKYQFKALNYCNQYLYPVNKLTQFTNIASVYAQFFQYDSVLFYYNKARACLPLLNEKEKIEYTYFLDFVEAFPLAYSKKIYQSNNNLFKALEYYKTNSKINALYCYQLLGFNHNNLKLYNLSYQFIDTALQIARNLNLSNEILKIKGLKYQTDSSSENWYEAHKTLREIAVLKDSLFSAEYIKNKDDLITKYQSEKKEQQNIQLTNEKQTLFNFLIVLLILFIILSVLAYFLVKQSKKIKQFALEREMIISIISHDLRSPLNALLNLNAQSSYFVRNKKFNEFNQLAIDIDIASTNINNLINNLLVWAKIQHLKQEDTYTKNCKVINVVENTLKLYTPILLGKNITVNIIPTQWINTIQGNQYVLELITRNWLDNTIKYSKPTIIDIFIQNVAPQIVFIDNGFIPNETIQSINTQLKQKKQLNQNQSSHLGFSLMAHYASKENYTLLLKQENFKNKFSISW